MRKSMTFVAAAAALVACDGNPFVTTTTTTTTTTTSTATIPDSLASNLQSITYDPVAKTMIVEIAGIDGTATAVSYARNAAAEVGLGAGVEAYSIQEDPLDRLFVAVVAQSADGTVTAGAVSDGGQFNRFFSGTHYARTGSFDPPTSTSSAGSGQVSYAGDYTGLDNWSGPNPTLPAGTNPALQMSGPGRVTGQVFINANFSDMQLNGAVFNRRAIDFTATDPAGFPLTNLVLLPGDIAADGTFLGNVELPGATATPVGEYGGIFGGTSAASLGGTLVISNFLDGLDTESEAGFFVLTQCGMPGENAVLCASTLP